MLLTDNVSAIEVLAKGLKDLEEMTQVIVDRYEEVLGYQALSRSIVGGLRIHW